MALTTRQIAFSNPSRTTRQQIPPFLSKLYHMVNDPSTESLIRWSETGDSFYVFDHERFAKEVLPSWFKHGNFGSFVRQLNNYGFHKVPHLQQGVLRSDGEAEISHFENPYFQRGQSDLLCLIQRKRQGQDAGEDPPESTTQPPPPSGPTNATEPEQPSASNPAASKGAVIDVNSILHGIQAVKRHQHAISAELKELHQSNQVLWQEAFAARERHKKHHDTINRILKFLAGVFGQTTNSPRAQEVPHEASGDSGSLVQRRPNRLMIEGAVKKAVETNFPPMNLNEFMEPLDFEGGQANDGDRFSTVEPAGSRGISPTPSIAKESTIMGDIRSPTTSPMLPKVTAVSKIATPTPTTPNINRNSNTATTTTTTTTTTPNNNNNNNSASNLLSYPFPTVNQSQLNANNLHETFSPSFTTISTPNPTNPTTPNHNHNSTALTCSTPPIPNFPPGNESYIQSAIASLLNNPAQMQRVLAALQLQMPVTLPSDPNGTSDAINTANNTRTELSSPVIPEFMHTPDSQLVNSGSVFSLLDGSENMGALAYPVDDGSLQALGQNSQQLQRVEADVEVLSGHIDSLIECLGLDPNGKAVLRGENMDDIVTSDATANHGNNNNDNDQSTVPPSNQFPDPSPDFDFDTFFDSSGGGFGFGQGFELSNAQQANGSETIGAFLDEVQSVSNESDITIPEVGGGDLQQVTRKDNGIGGTRKRKSDAVELGDTKSEGAPRTRKKR